MIAALLLTGLLLGLQQRAPPHGPEPGARAALGGMAGFQSVSKIDFGTAENRLTAVYVFPDRVRWHFESYGAKERSEHEYLYRSGERIHQLASGQPSREVQGVERSTVLLQMELRRAAMLWPDGFEWESAKDGTRVAGVLADSCCRELALGSLVATLADGRPCSIVARDQTGRALETLEVREWQERGGRTWPRVLALPAESGGFVETIESIETRVHFLEQSFVPPDIRPRPAVEGLGQNVRSLDLVAMTYAPRELSVGIGWEAALDQARRWIAEAREALEPEGLAVDPVPTFELSSEGRPVKCLVRLAAAVRPAPDGFETRAERVGLLLPLEELGAVDASVLARLAKATPGGARPGTPYLRLHARPSLPVELVLPFETTE